MPPIDVQYDEQTGQWSVCMEIASMDEERLFRQHPVVSSILHVDFDVICGWLDRRLVSKYGANACVWWLIEDVAPRVQLPAHIDRFLQLVLIPGPRGR